MSEKTSDLPEIHDIIRRMRAMMEATPETESWSVRPIYPALQSWISGTAALRRMKYNYRWTPK